MQAILGSEIDSGEGDQGTVAWVFNRLDAGDASRDIGMVTCDVSDQLRLGACRAGDQDGPRRRDRLGDLLEEMSILGHIAAPDRVRVVMNVSGRGVRIEHYPIDLDRAELEDSRFPMVDPNDRVIMDVHSSRLEALPKHEHCVLECRAPQHESLDYGLYPKSQAGSETTQRDRGRMPELNASTTANR